MSARDEEREVARPSIPPLLWAVLCLAGGLYLAELIAWRTRGVTGALTWLLVGAAIGLMLAVLLWARRSNTAALCVLGLAAGVCIGALYWVHLSQTSEALERVSGSRWDAVVVSDAVDGEFGARSDVRVRCASGEWVSMKASWPKGKAPPELGTRVSVFASAVAQKDPSRAEQEFQAGDAGSLRVRLIESVRWDDGLTGVAARARSWADARVRDVPGEGSALLASALLGDRRRLRGTRLDTDMKVAGLAHFEATSGYHLLLVGAVVEWALLGVGLGRRTRGALALALTGAFVLLSGGRTSVVRGWIMAALGRGGWQAGRRSDAVSGLSLCAAAMLCASPAALFDMAFQLSVLAVLGILLFARLSEGWVRASLPRRLGRAAGPVAVTLCAVLATAPLSAPAFGFMSPVAPLSNLLAAPLVVASLLTGLAGIGLSGVSAGVGAAVIRMAAAFSGMLGSLAATCAQLPYSAIPATAGPLTACAGLAAAAGLWLWWPQPRRPVGRLLGRVAVACSLVVLVPWPSLSGPRIVVLDVGQGDAILVTDAGHNLLIDCGPTGPALLTALAREHVTRLDGVVVTHLHADHYGGLEAAESVLRVPDLYLPRGTLSRTYAVVNKAREGLPEGGVHELGLGDALNVGDVRLRVVSPRAPVEDAATNEASVVMVAERASDSVLLTGDAEEGVVQPAVDAGDVSAVDVLKVGHHGSAISMSPTLLAALQPRQAVISVGVGNRYGHPKPAALAMLRNAGVPTLRTDLDGDVTIVLAGDGVHVRGARRRGSYVATFEVRELSLVHTAARSYATLVSTDSHTSTPESDVRDALRSQARLPHLRDRGPPACPGALEAQAARG